MSKNYWAEVEQDALSRGKEMIEQQERTLSETELAGLQQLADTTDAENGAALVGPDGEELPPAPEPIDWQNEAKGTVDMFSALVIGYAPKAEPLWSDAKKRQMAAALAPVMEKYGVSMGKLPPEIVLVIVAGPVLFQTSKIIAMEVQEQKLISVTAPAGVPAAAVPATPGLDQSAPPLSVESFGAASAPDVMHHPQMGLYKR